MGKRITLLSDAEIDDIYSIPVFNKNEQDLYFTFNKLEQEALERYSGYKTYVYFILQLGYFKAKQQFFNFNFEDVSNDVIYINKAFANTHGQQLSGCISREYMRQQKQEILSLCGYKDWSTEYELQVKDHIGELLKYYPRIQGVMRHLLDYFDNHQIVIPTYITLQNIFTDAYSVEESRLSTLTLSMPKNIQQQLSSLIESNDGISQLSIVKADQKDFHLTAVRDEVAKAQLIAEIYEVSKIFIPTLTLSKNAVCYYAELVEQYSPFRLRNLNEAVQWLYAICFVYYRYQQIMDNLITSFMYHTRGAMESSKIYVKIAQMEHNAKMLVDFPKLAQFLEWFPKRDQTLTHEELNKKAYEILPEEQFPLLAKFINGSTFNKKAAKWEYYAKSSRMLSLYFRPIILTIPLEFYQKDNKIMELVNLLKSHYLSGKNSGSFKLSDDLGFTIPKHMLPYLKRTADAEHVDPHLFEFYVYEKIYHNLDRGKLFCNDSVSFRDIALDLVDEAMVDKIDEIASKFGYTKIPGYCDERLDDALKMLSNSWKTTTENINNGCNTGFQIKETKNGEVDWSLSYDASEELDDSFFRNLPKIPIPDIMMFIGDLTGMWSGFDHIKDRYIKSKTPVELVINACILAEAFGVGAVNGGAKARKYGATLAQ